MSTVTGIIHYQGSQIYFEGDDDEWRGITCGYLLDWPAEVQEVLKGWHVEAYLDTEGQKIFLPAYGFERDISTWLEEI